MAGSVQSGLAQRLLRLENHLAHENPVLLDVVRSFRRLDRVGHRLGVLDPDESYATRVPWWPLIAVLGTFSSGKSTFINDILKYKLQLTGNQAVDDKFTVICYSTDDIHRSLPGLALDADPRFPFYNISRDIESVASGEGRRVDAYLQLKTCPSVALRGKILIDSPGFDADLQRTSTLRITDHIIDLSDLVLVFFDARHPEPGAMKDTLQHLVADTLKRPDSSKFMFILNQIDATAREDNPEEVFAAWQRALASAGLTAGRFYRIYNLEAANPIDDPNLRRRFEAKRAIDMAEVLERMQQVEVERAYRIIGVLETSAKAIESELVPRLRAARQRWKRRVLWIDGLIYGSVIGASVFALMAAGGWEGLAAALSWPDPVLWAVVGMGGPAAPVSACRRTAPGRPLRPAHAHAGTRRPRAPRGTGQGVSQEHTLEAWPPAQRAHRLGAAHQGLHRPCPGRRGPLRPVLERSLREPFRPARWSAGRRGRDVRQPGGRAAGTPSAVCAECTRPLRDPADHRRRGIVRKKSITLFRGAPARRNAQSRRRAPAAAPRHSFRGTAPRQEAGLVGH